MRSYDSTAPVVPFAVLTLVISVIAVLLSGCGLGVPPMSAASMPVFEPPSRRAYGLGGPRDTSKPIIHHGDGEIITVERGDTLIGIGKRYDVPMSVLIEQNKLLSVQLHPGSTLFIPKRQSVAQH
jgi:hypothetical protein